MPRAVLLRHDTPDGGAHFDWLLARDGDDAGAGAGPCLTFRVRERIDRPAPGGAFDAERAPDHRPFYLHHEGEVSGGRGVVTRVAAGVVHTLHDNGDRVEADIAWESGVNARYIGERTDGARWRFVFHES